LKCEPELKPELKAPNFIIHRLKPNYLPSSFVFILNVRRYTKKAIHVSHQLMAYCHDFETRHEKWRVGRLTGASVPREPRAVWVRGGASPVDFGPDACVLAPITIDVHLRVARWGGAR
jgi:hypothetical protein